MVAANNNRVMRSQIWSERYEYNVSLKGDASLIIGRRCEGRRCDATGTQKEIRWYGISCLFHFIDLLCQKYHFTQIYPMKR